MADDDDVVIPWTAFSELAVKNDNLLPTVRIMIL